MPALQLPMFAKCDTLPKGHLVDHGRPTCLRHPFISIPLTPLGNSNHKLSTRSLSSRERQYVRQLCIMVEHHAHPFVAAAGKNLSHRDKQRVWSRSYGLQDLLQCSDLLSVVLYDCCKPMSSCRDWAFSNSGLEVGLPAFQLPMFAKCDTLPKGDLFDMFVQGIHAIFEI